MHLPCCRLSRCASLSLLLFVLVGLTVLTDRRVSARADEPAVGGSTFALKPGDHICLIGNTLADRMQHDGWLEALLQARFPQHHLVVRDLGFSGDELNLRLRSAGFGSPEQWLRKEKTDVVLAFFGYNEAYAGPAGVDRFRRDLSDFIKQTRGQNYNGKTPARLVLCSPIAHEDLHDRNLPDGRENNKYLELYTAVMADVASANHVPFVDLFHPTFKHYPEAGKPLTINGVHLNTRGNEFVAKVIDDALFGAPTPSRDRQTLEKLRQAILDKNHYWFNRYRTTDGYNVYGGRSYERYLGQTNREVLQREMEILDAMTANRDQRVWAVAQGKDITVDDRNLPPQIPVKSNIRGPGPHGEFNFLDPQEAIKKMTVARGMKVTLFASEKDFPALAKPVQMAFDTKGRLWVAVWPSYPHWKPSDPMNDKLLVLEDTKGTGKADKCTVFADHLNCPTGFAFYNGGVLLAQAPAIEFLKDTRGTGKADLRVRVIEGMDSADTHHTSNSFALDPGGAVYFQEGTFHHTQVETPYGPPERCVNAGVFRYEPRTQKFEVYISCPFANPHGHVFDHWGQDFVYDGTGANPYHAVLFSGHVEYPNKHPQPPQVYQQWTRPCPGVEILSSRHFPPENQSNLLVANVIGFQGILQYKVEDRGASFVGTQVDPVVSSSDPNFRPVDLKVAPDGSIYFLDWYNPIIGHLQHHIRDPNRDRIHGRIYRITYEGRPLLKPTQIAGQPIDHLLEVLKEPEDRVRERARIELGGRPTDEVMAALAKWIERLDPKDPDYEHQMLEALWLHQSHNVVDEPLLLRLLFSPDSRARAAATRVLCYWRERIPKTLSLLRILAADPAPRVRLEAVRTASFFTVPEAVEVPVISAQYPTDIYLDYTRGETMKALEPYWRKALAEGRDIPFTSDAGARFFLKNVSTPDLLRMKRSRAVFVEMLFRKGILDEYRHEALAGLARMEKQSELRVLLRALSNQDAASQTEESSDESVAFDLIRLLTDHKPAELTELRPNLQKLATTGRREVTRQLGFVALFAADGGVDRVWEMATRKVQTLEDLVAAMPLIRDPNIRASLYPRVEPLLHALPKGLASHESDRLPTYMGRYVRVELPGRQRTLTLAEVEVYSDGHNVAREGKATQDSTAYGGEASRAIDGNKNGSYGAGGQTHSNENVPNPWWEVDLGHEYPIETIAIYNRTDGNLGRRLRGFTLSILDSARQVIWQRKRLQAPRESEIYVVGGNTAEGVLRRAAMTALTFVRGQETETFKTLAPFARSGPDRTTAIHALMRIPTSYWLAQEARPLLDSIMTRIRALPAQERTGAEALEAMQLGEALAGLLPPEEARAVRRQLGDLGVRIIRIGTLPEQMLYDKERLVVQAGKPVEIVFENNDLMPHNLVLVRPGALEEVGTLADATGNQPDAMSRDYVPASDKVLFHSRLLPSRQVQKLSLTAPTQAGVYPYVCTFPGHWRRMFGALYVVPDLESYMADPLAYLTHHRLPVADELLKLNRPRTEWKYEELAPLVSAMETGRSFANGKQLFQATTCVACHRLNGAGIDIGPDLSKLEAAKFKPTDILRDIIEPSWRIEDKYATYVFAMESGKVVSGVVLEENGDTVKVIENPLAKSKPVLLKKSEIAERRKSPTSIMPKGLLDKLNREEILDLVAYVAARGNPDSPLFQGNTHAHDHHSQ